MTVNRVIVWISLVIFATQAHAAELNQSFSMFHFIHDGICQGGLSGYMIDQLSMSGICELQYTQRDASLLFLSDVFGNVEGALASGSNQLLGQMFYIFNSAILIMVSVFATYIVMTGVVNTARDGSFMGQQKGGMWPLIRTILGITLVVPRTSGYCIMQVIIMYIVVTGVQFANLMWGFAELYYVSNGNSLLPSNALKQGQQIFRAQGTYEGFVDNTTTTKAGEEDGQSEVISSSSYFDLTYYNFLNNKMADSIVEDLGVSSSYLLGSNICQAFYSSLYSKKPSLFVNVPLNPVDASSVSAYSEVFGTNTTALQYFPFIEMLMFFNPSKDEDALKEYILGGLSNNSLKNCGQYFLGNTLEKKSDYKDQLEETDSQILVSYLVSKYILSTLSSEMRNNFVVSIPSTLSRVATKYPDILTWSHDKSDSNDGTTSQLKFESCNSYMATSNSDPSYIYGCYMQLLSECFTGTLNANDNTSISSKYPDFNLTSDKTSGGLCQQLMSPLHDNMATILESTFDNGRLRSYVNQYASSVTNSDADPTQISGGWAMAGALFSFPAQRYSGFTPETQSELPPSYLSTSHIATGVKDDVSDVIYITWDDNATISDPAWYYYMSEWIDPSDRSSVSVSDCSSLLTSASSVIDYNDEFGSLNAYLKSMLTCYISSIKGNLSDTLSDADSYEAKTEVTYEPDEVSFDGLYEGLLGGNDGGKLFDQTAELENTSLDSYASESAGLAWIPFYSWATKIEAFETGPVGTLTKRWKRYQIFILDSWFTHFSVDTDNSGDFDETITSNPFLAVQQFGAKLISGGISFLVLGVNDIIVNLIKTASAFKSLVTTYFTFVLLGHVYQGVTSGMRMLTKFPLVPPISFGQVVLPWVAIPFGIGVLLQIIFDVVLWLATIPGTFLMAFAPTFLPLLGMWYQIVLFQKTLYVPLFAAAVSPFLLIGALFSVYIPLLPMVIYSLTFVNWILSVFELMIAAPLVALGIAYPTGHDLLGSSSKMMTMLITALIRPVSIVIGFIMSVILAFIALIFFSYVTVDVILVNLGYFDILTYSTSGEISDITSYSSLSAVQQVVLMAILLIYCYILLSVLSACFSYTYLLPYTITKWLDPSSAEGSQSEAEEIQDILGGFTSFMGKASDAGGQFMSQGDAFQLDATDGLSYRLEQSSKGSGVRDEQRERAMGI